MNMLNDAITYIKKDIAGALLLFLVILQYSNFYRVAMRCIYEGGEFQWMETWGVSILGKEKAMRIMGNGLEGHFLIIFLLAVLFLAVTFSLVRRADDPLGRFLVFAFTGAMAAKEIMLSLTYADRYKVVGETFRLNIDYSILGPVFSLTIFGLAVWWTFRRGKETSVGPISRRINGVVGLLCIPAFLALRLGNQHDWTDIIGISLIYMQFIILVLNWVGLFSNTRELSGQPSPQN